MVAAHHDRVGLLVDLRVGVVPHAGMGVFLAVGQAHQDLDLDQACRPPAGAPRGSLELAQADREQHVDRVLADDGREHAAAGVDEIARV